MGIVYVVRLRIVFSRRGSIKAMELPLDLPLYILREEVRTCRTVTKCTVQLLLAQWNSVTQLAKPLEVRAHLKGVAR